MGEESLKEKKTTRQEHKPDLMWQTLLSSIFRNWAPAFSGLFDL